MKKDDPIDFAKLIRKCLAGDEKAWCVLMERVLPIISGICGEMGLSQEQRFDVQGSVRLILLQNLGQLRKPDKLLTYVGTITKREALAIIRTTRQNHKFTSRILEELYGSTNRTPEEIFESVRQIEAVTKAMALLPEKCFRLLWELFFDEDNPSYKEISKRLGIPVQSIGPTRKRCLKKMRDILKKNNLI